MCLQLTATGVRRSMLQLSVCVASFLASACDGPDATVPTWTPPAPQLDASAPSNTAGATGTSSSAGTSGGSGTLAAPVPMSWPPNEEPGKLDAGPMDAAGSSDGEDAGPWLPPDPICVDGRWQLAPGFVVSRRVDYVADRIVKPKNTSTASTETADLISSAGVPCETAKNRATCESALSLPVPFGRHLVTTSGDEVKIWHAAQGRVLLGLLDTKSEALWWLESNSPYQAPCDVQVTIENGAFVLDGVIQNIACDPTFVDAAAPPSPERSKVSIQPDGSLIILRDAPIAFSTGCNPVPPVPVPGF